MNLFSSLVFIIFAIGSISLQSLYLMKNKERKLLMIQFGIVGMAILGGVFLIYMPHPPSIAQVLMAWMK